jgi:uncharacterized phage protein gp47/JayE
MIFGITPTGFVKKTYTDIQAEMGQDLLSYKPDLNLDFRQPAGQIISVCSKVGADIWDEMAEIYAIANPAEASGASLDNNYALLNLVRIDAYPTEVLRVAHYLTGACTIPAGTKVAQSSTNQTFTLQADVVWTGDPTFRFAEFSLQAVNIGQTVTLSVDAIDASHLVVSGDTKTTILEDIADQIGARARVAEEVLFIDGGLVDFSIDNSALELDRFGLAGDYLCDVTGAISCPQNTIDTIVNSVSGWVEVNNPDSGGLGRDTETDAEYRLRAQTYFLYGMATEEGIRQYILNTVEGVQSCRVRSNRTGLVVGELPANSLEVVVSGGNDADLAEAIWYASPAGIELYGITSQSVTDTQGNSQIVKFTRPAFAKVWLQIEFTTNSEEAFPVNGVDMIKRAITTWAASFYSAGRNVYARDILTPINTISGLGDVTVLIGQTTGDIEPLVFNSTALQITYAFTASFDLARIEVTQV